MTSLIVHAVAAYEIVPGTEDAPVVERTIDWEYRVEPLYPRAERGITEIFDQLKKLELASVTQYRIPVPAEIADRFAAGEGEAISEWMDEVEWSQDWHGQPIVRQNALGKARTAEVEKIVAAQPA